MKYIYLDFFYSVSYFCAVCFLINYYTSTSIDLAIIFTLLWFTSLQRFGTLEVRFFNSNERNLLYISISVRSNLFIRVNNAFYTAYHDFASYRHFYLSFFFRFHCLVYSYQFFIFFGNLNIFTKIDYFLDHLCQFFVLIFR